MRLRSDITGLRGGGPSVGMAGRRYPALPDSLGQQGVGHDRAPALLRGRQFRDHPVAVGDQHGFTLLGKAHVLTELVLQDF